MENVTADTIALVKTAQSMPLPDEINRSFVQPGSATTGLIAYDLEIPSKKLYPVLTPLRNRIARRADGFSIQSNWRAVNGINTGSTFPGVSESNRGGAISQTTSDYFAKFVGLGLENYVTFEADYASKNFEDVKSLAVVQLLQSLMIQEEFCDLGGNGTQLLGQTGTPVLAEVLTGGTLMKSTPYYASAVALTLQGYQQLVAANNGSVGGSPSWVTGLTQVYSRTNTDSTSDNINGGTAKPSAALGTVTTGSGGIEGARSVTCTVTPLTGAVAYAWYFGTQANGSDVRLAAVTTTNQATITALPAGTNQLITALTATDNSTNSLVYDGMLTQIMKSGSGAYSTDLAATGGVANGGAKLTTDGAGGITEINTAFASFWDNYRLSPDEIFVGSQVLMDLNTLVIKNGGAPLIRFNLDANNTAALDAGTAIATILNKITNTKVKVNIHPNMPAGMIMFWSNSVPYPLNDIGSIVLKHLRRDYYQIEWPLRTRKYEYGVYMDGVLKNYFPPAFGLIRNILPGV